MGLEVLPCRHWAAWTCGLSGGINDFLARQFFPMLIPGRSIVIQQDYVHPTCPWLAVTMEYLAEYFEPVAYVPGNSMVYAVSKAIPVEAVDGGVISALPDDTKRTLMDRAVERCATVLAPADLVEVEAARTLLILSTLGADAAQEDLERLRAVYAASPRLPCNYT